MKLSPSSDLEKMRKYCAYQERSHHQVEQKMYDLRIPQDQQDIIILNLMQDNFLNEERFARAFVRGRFNIKKWGRLKVIKGLKQHRVGKKCIQLSLQEIDDGAYLNVLKNIVEKKNSQLKVKDVWRRRSAIYRFAIQRGFESGLINEAMKRLLG